jgi:hypothetical protein
MLIPSLAQAEAQLAEAGALNPGVWIDHSRVCARSAQALAARLPGLDPEAAYIVALLHDIGRRGGPSHMRHLVDGYDYLCERGHHDAARICLTHSFPLKEVRSYCGEWDVSSAQLSLIVRFISASEYDDYDRLVQLVDSCCLPTGPVLMEKRLVDVYLRYGSNEYLPAKWRAYLDLERQFSARLGCSIYALWPGVVDNTFGAWAAHSLPLPCGAQDGAATECSAGTAGGAR